MEADPTQAYNQNDATGFIRLQALRLKVSAGVGGPEAFGVTGLGAASGAESSGIERSSGGGE